jgi:thiol-disulfide isomerase/thioredoxin
MTHYTRYIVFVVIVGLAAAIGLLVWPRTVEVPEVGVVGEVGDVGKVGEDGETGYVGNILAGSASPVIDFNETDYRAALASERLVVLYFYANWCPICRAEVPEMYRAFDQLTTDEVIGFRINFKDNETDDIEEQLAREYGVAYQHTKVFVQNGERILKSPEGWDTRRYLDEINRVLTK